MHFLSSIVSAASQNLQSQFTLDRPLVILDVDQTLIFASKESINRKPDFEVFDYVVYKRPNLIEFIERLDKSYDIAIWSSAGNEYVNSIINQLKLNIDLQFIWGRNEATQKRQLNDYYETGNDTEYYYVKPLKKVKRKGYDLDPVSYTHPSPRD